MKTINIKLDESLNKILSFQDDLYIKGYHDMVSNIISYNNFRKVILKFSNDTKTDIWGSCELIVEEMKKKYNING